VEDPAAFEGPEEKQRWIFRRAYLQLERRIELFTNLKIESLDRLSLQARLNEIGKTEAPVEEGG
jgi:arsenate reductase